MLNSFLFNIFITTGLSTLILIGLSKFLGQIWAERLMNKERNEHSKELEMIRSNLREDSEKQLASVRNELELLRERQLRTHNDKLVIYRSAMDNIVLMLAKLELIVTKQRPPPSI